MLRIPKVTNSKNILITGASSGIGQALAIEYSIKGNKLFLFGRSEQKLLATANQCIAKEAEAQIYVCDVKDQKQMDYAITQIMSQHNLDYVICSAGVSAGTLNDIESEYQVYKIFDTNLTGVLNTITPVIPRMIKRNSGNIVLISSMAGLIGLASSPSYSASKAAVKILGDGLRGHLKQFNVSVNVVVPGYVATPMTEVNNFPMPLMISAEKAAKIICKGISQDKGVIAFPYITYLILKIINLLPYRLVDFINRRLPGKANF